MSDQYDIFFAGKIADGFEEATVRENLARMFKANEQTVARLFSGKPQAIKRGVDRQTAVKYKSALQKAGAVPLIRASGGAAQQTPAADTAPAADAAPKPSMVERVAALAAEKESMAPAPGATEAAAPATHYDADLSLAPVGSDVLREEERAAVEAVDVDTSAIDLASPFDDSPLQEHTEPPPAPDTSHLSMGEAGEPIPTLQDDVVALDPDTSHLSMGAAGETIPTLDEPVQALDPDTDGIELAPEGSDVLDPEYRKRDTATPPPTDHLSLED